MTPGTGPWPSRWVRPAGVGWGDVTELTSPGKPCGGLGEGSLRIKALWGRGSEQVTDWEEHQIPETEG